MDWHPVEGVKLLAPFDHQVAGQSSMLKYDATTVCKPLIAREHFVYKTLPTELKPFTPEYRGEIEVQLSEEDGYIQLFGMSIKEDNGSISCPCSNDLDALLTHEHPMSTSAAVNIDGESTVQNRCMIRVLHSGSYEFSSTTEEVFCAENSTSPSTHKLNPWSLKNHKRLLDKMRKSEHTHNKIRFLLLENVVADFRHPCILDLKIGSRLHGDDASQVKVASQQKKCSETTSSTLGLRLCGMQVYHIPSGVYHSVDKFYGRTLNDLSFRQLLHSFLHNSLQFRRELVPPIVDQLTRLLECLKSLDSYRFYASSLLIIYDGEVSTEGQNRSPSGIASSLQSTQACIPNDLPKEQMSQNPCNTQTVESESVKPGLNSVSDSASLQHSTCFVPQSKNNKHSSTETSDNVAVNQKQITTAKATNILDNAITFLPGVHSTEDLIDLKKDNNFSLSDNHTLLNHQKSLIYINNFIDSNRTDKLCDLISQTTGKKEIVSPVKTYESTDINETELTTQLNSTNEHLCAPVVAKETRQAPPYCNSTVKVDVKMIDFAHTTHQGFTADRIKHSGPDADYIKGLENLIALFTQLLHEA